MRGPLLVTTLLLAACEPAAAAPTADAGLAQRMDAMEDRLARIEATLTSAHKDITSMKESVDDLHRKIDDAPAAPPAPSAVPPRRTPRPPLEEIEHITCDEDACHVDRSYLETLFEKPAELARQARVVPAVEDGETIGFKLYGIRSGSLPHALGFSNGDLIKRVNGDPWTSIEDVMNSAKTLETADKITIEVERKGEGASIVMMIEDK